MARQPAWVNDPSLVVGHWVKADGQTFVVTADMRGQEESILGPGAFLPKDALDIPWWLYMTSYAGAALGAYHGYRRHRGSVGWAVGWAFVGSLVPIITIPLSLAQGFGKPKGR